MRAPYQVLVFPYYINGEGIEYAIFRRSDANWWQAISGGGEDGETVIESAKREAWEEGGISKDSLQISDKKLKLSHEHTEYKWMNYNDAISYLKWDGNKVALWELNKRLKCLKTN